MSSRLRRATDSRPSSIGLIRRDACARPWMLGQELFTRMLCLERKRTERSHRRFVLMLLDAQALLKTANHEEAFEGILAGLSLSTRETDIKGWYRDGTVIGIIFTEVGAAEGKSVADALLTKVTKALSSALSIDNINEISLSFHVFPEDWDKTGQDDEADSVLYPDLVEERKPKRATQAVKRAMDISGSFFALALLSPLLILIAAAIRFTSKGPILFRQERLGQHGKRFTFLKFRSMYMASGHAIHEEYMKRFITQQGASERVEPGGGTVYKLTQDPRVTAVGRFLRRTSLDELPQFLNVLFGEMSLVGPRPPIPYEFSCYDVWHKRRLLAVKPGITGLWQVEGRSKVQFDEMVRLDLQYARSWSLWLDIKILLRTPRAVLAGDGAY